MPRVSRVDPDLQELLRKAESSGELILARSMAGRVPEAIRQITGLRRLVLKGQQLRDLPNWLSELQHLEALDISDNPLHGMPSVIGDLPALRHLSLSKTGIILFPSDVPRLHRLTSLVLSDNNIQVLPREIGSLNHLRVLDVGRNRLDALPDETGNLEHLSELYLWGNNLRHVPTCVRRLHSLKILDISSNGTHEMPKDLTALMSKSAVTRISGDGQDRRSSLQAIPAWLFESLQELEIVNLSGNHIEQIPLAVNKLGMLRALLLRNNRIGACPKTVTNLTNLAYLDLSSNRISTVPQNLQNLRRLRYLDLSGNPLPLPPEILGRQTEPQSVIDYLSRLVINTRPLDEAKLLVVGEGSVGKTSLIKRLVYDEFDQHEDITEGIEITRWRLGLQDTEVTLNIWDFGGQEIMHATHQFFLTRRSVYMLVIDTRQDEEQNRIEYWLKLIQSFSGGSPIIIVGNKADQSPLDIDQRGLRAKYPDIREILSTSCIDGRGIGDLHDILSSIVTGLPHVQDLLPESFFAVKDKLEGMESDYIPFEDFKELCVEHGIDQKKSQELLIGFLHDLGTVLCFRDDPRLANTNILNPQWVTGGVYKILNSNLAAQRKGLLSFGHIAEILESREYPVERCSFIVDMMRKFELCYEADDIFLIPDLLTKEEPLTGAWDNVLRFRVKFEVLPSSVMCRLIVRMNSSISQGTVWRTGVVLGLDDTKALVKSDREDGFVSIDVSGPGRARRGLLTAIRTELRNITKTIPGLSYEEQVPVPRHSGIYVPYSHLLDLEAAGHQTVIPQGTVEAIRIDNLLDGVERRSDRLRSDDQSLEPLGDDASSADKDPLQRRPSLVQAIAAWLGFVLPVPILLGLSAAVHRYLEYSFIPTLVVSVLLAAGGSAVLLRALGKLSKEDFVSLIGTMMRSVVKTGASSSNSDVAKSPGLNSTD